MGKVNCCCCIPIRAGVITLAVLGLIGGTILVFSGAALIFTVFGNYQHDETASYAATFLFIIYIILGIYCTILGLFGTIMSIILFKGVYQENIGLLKTWAKISCIVLWTSVVFLIVKLIIFAAYLIAYEGHEPNLTYPGFALLFYGAIVLCIFAFYISVVKKYFGNLEEDLNQGRVKEKA